MGYKITKKKKKKNRYFIYNILFYRLPLISKDALIK